MAARSTSRSLTSQIVQTRTLAPEDCLHCSARSCGVFRYAQRTDLQAVHTQTTRRAHAAGDVVWREFDAGTGVVCMHQGHALVRAPTPEGNIAFATVVAAGHAFGLAEAITGGSRALRAQALTSVEACFIPKKSLLSSLERSPAIARGIATTIAEIQLATTESFYGQCAYDAQARVVRAILRLRADFGSTSRGDATTRIRLPMSRRDLAELASVTPETLSRVIAALRERGVMRFDGSDAHVLDMKAAQALAESPRDR